MAGRDYIRCKTCQTKIIYDGNDCGRERLEEIWGDENADEWTVFLLCPDCIKKLEESLTTARDCVRAGKYSTALKVLSR